MGGLILRDPAAAAGETYDLIIIGGGVYGATLALEAAHRGLRPVLLERDDFGGATSWNNLRIIHGGLRYLQKLDLPRFFESVGERRWFLQNFPDQVEPLPCLMPIYGDGLRKAPILRGALLANDLLSARRNQGVRADRSLPAGRLIGREETLELFPRVAAEGLQGGALWYDAVMPDSQRVMIEILRRATAAGGTVLNYTEVTQLLGVATGVAGVVVRDRVSGKEHEFRASRIINAAGPWSRELAKSLDRDVPELFRASVAINLFLNRESFSKTAVAATARRSGAPTLFLYPWKGKLFAGTYHAAWDGSLDRASPGSELIQEFIDELNAAVPGQNFSPSDVIRTHWGLLPAKHEGSGEITVRPVIHDHSRAGGPQGLFSVSGVKFTTARRVAEQALLRVFGPAAAWTAGAHDSVPPRQVTAVSDALRLLDTDPASLRAEIDRLIAEEAAVCQDDLLLRRTDWGIDPDKGRVLRNLTAEALPRDLPGR